ncbi:MAG: hypothetical protein Q4B08_13845, partial [Propionibacteriaceae bacterium]|nr:hypothetical protein [Propionibacteriaceae bacterium]
APSFFAMYSQSLWILPTDGHGRVWPQVTDGSVYSEAPVPPKSSHPDSRDPGHAASGAACFSDVSGLT